MNLDARGTPLDVAGHRDLEPLACTDPPESAGALMAEDHVWPTGEDRCHPVAVPRQMQAPDRVDAPPHRVQPRCGNAVIDRLFAEAELEELRPRDRAMLSSREAPTEGIAGWLEH